jgi:hypothetical protein
VGRGRPIPDNEYQTKDFERVVALRARTQAIARHLTDFLKKTDRFAQTIVFRVDQEHASEMRAALSNLSSDLVKRYPDYVCRVTADEGDIGRGHLGRFQEENERAWQVPAAELLASNCNLDRKNPRAKEDIAHLPPEQIAASILEKEQRIAEIMGRIQKLLARSAEP